MATSGSIDWTTTRDEIIKAAYRLVVVDEDFAPTTNQTSNASLLLNAITKSYNAKLGMPLWAMGTGFILPFTTSYSTNSTSGYVTASYSQTTLSLAGDTSDLTIEVTSTSGIGNGYFIGIEADSGDMHWTTVNGSLSGNTVTITAALPADSAIAFRPDSLAHLELSTHTRLSVLKRNLSRMFRFVSLLQKSFWSSQTRPVSSIHCS
jgi:hypothetical protein